MRSPQEKPPYKEDVLAYIKRHQPVTVSDVANAFDTKHGTIVNKLMRIESTGMALFANDKGMHSVYVPIDY